MSKRQFRGPGGPGQFIMEATGASARRPIQRLCEILLGRGAVQQDFTFTFRQEEQLAEFCAKRVELTLQKYLFTILLLDIQQLPNPLVVVEGAKLQTGTGNSSRVKHGNVSYFVGHEAAHFGIGTFTMQGQPVAILAQQKLLNLAQTRGVPPADIPSRYEANAFLIVRSLVLDADTYVAPAFINRTEGLQEVTRQHYMHGLLPILPSNTAAALERQLVTSGERAIHLLAYHNRAVIRPLEERLAQIRAGTAKEFLQDPSDSMNALFGGQERNLLTALIALAKNTSPAGAAYHAMIDNLGRRLPELAQDLVLYAIQAKAERT